jgi:hypothetical protein
MFNLVVLPREAIRPFSATVILRAVDVFLLMYRFEVSHHIRFAGERSGAIWAVLWFPRFPIPKLVTLLEKLARWMVRRSSDFLTPIWWILGNRVRCQPAGTASELAELQGMKLVGLLVALLA